MAMNKYYVLLIISFFLVSVSTNTLPLVETNDAIMTEEATEIEILLVMDYDYEAAYHVVRPILERFGWSITVAGTSEILNPCPPQEDTATLESDILIYEVDDITKYDVISIMPGSAHDILRTNQTCIDLIQSAVYEGLVVSAWCRAVRVLATADVIDGKNITGHADYESEYEAAGATFFDEGQPIIDGNLVTSGADRVNRDEVCDAIATTLGVFEENPPEITSVSFNPAKMVFGSSTNMTSIFSDESGAYYARAEFFLLDETGVRSTDKALSVELDKQSTNIFTGNITGLHLGNYTVDIYVKDPFLNSITHTDESLLVVELPDAGNPNASDLPLPIDPMLLVGLGGVGVLVAVVVIVKMKKD